jgi:hypothetical protein
MYSRFHLPFFQPDNLCTRHPFQCALLCIFRINQASAAINLIVTTTACDGGDEVRRFNADTAQASKAYVR